MGDRVRRGRQVRQVRQVLMVAMIVLVPALMRAQTPAAAERVTFHDAVQRAEQNNPSVAAAASNILRAEALLSEARAATRVQVSGTVTETTLNEGTTFNGETVTPQNSLTASVSATMPVYAPAAWARRVQDLDAKQIAELNVEDVKRQIADATADAFLTIIANRRLVETNAVARENAKAHFDYATQLEQAGAGSKLNRLRAQEEVSTDDLLVESANLALYRAQEALSVLLSAAGPVDAADDPTLDAPPAELSLAALIQQRSDLKLYSAQVQAAQRVLGDSRKDYLPSVSATFQPQAVYPAQLFSPQYSWRFFVAANIPIFDSGQRSGQKAERQAALDLTRATLASATTLANSQVRAAREAVASADRGLTSAKAAADTSHQVLDIVNVSFAAGASTNIEVIDAQRSARDADTAMAVAEDTLRRAKLELLIALGKFPA